MKLTITPDVFQKFNKDFRVVFIAVKGIDNSDKAEESKHLLKEIQQLVKLTFNKDTMENHSLIQSWLAARQEYGKKAIHYHTSTEKLIRKVLRGQSIVSGNTLENLVRYLSLKHIMPMSVDDLSKINGDLIITVAKKKERLSALKSLHEGEIYYRDHSAILGKKLDSWRNRVTRVDAKTTSALIHIESLPPITGKKLQQVTRELQSLVKVFCRGTSKVVLLDKDKKTIEI